MVGAHVCTHTYTMESFQKTLNLVLGVSFILNKWSKQVKIISGGKEIFRKGTEK